MNPINSTYPTNPINLKDPMNSKNLKAVLFKSEYRFNSFREKLLEYGIDCTILSFENCNWMDFDYSTIDIIIHYPVFKHSSNHPLALQEVYDNLMFIHSRFPHIKMYPDPKLIPYYNDKYKQCLFLKANNYPMPKTIPIFSEESVDLADRKLGYPMVIKNRYGAGGEFVFRVSNKKELSKFYNLSKMNLFNLSSLKYFLGMLRDRLFYYHLIKEKNMPYPFPSSPLLAQKFIKMDRDLKTVVGAYKVIEAHWRIKANEEMWKVNIDGGGIGEWSKVPEEAIELSVNLAKDLKANWINIDLILNDGKFLITEFSPVWHHYAYKEKPSFIYKEDYNIDTPLAVSLDLERMIIESLVNSVKSEGV